MRSTGSYDTGPSGDLLGKPILAKIFAEGVVGYAQIRPLSPHHSMPDTYASIITAIKEVYGHRMLGPSVSTVEQFHRMFDQVGPQNINTRAMLDPALRSEERRVGEEC